MTAHGMAPFALAVSLAAAHATASPLEDPTSTGAAVFTGPTSPYGPSLFINPAALGLASRGQHIYVASSLRLTQLKIDRQIVNANGTTRAAETSSSNATSPGGMVAFDFSPTKGWRVGLSLHTPLARRHPANQPALRYHVAGGHSYQIAGTASTAVAATSRILFGLGISLGYSHIRRDFARDSALEAGTAGIESTCDTGPCGIENSLADEHFSVSTRTGSVGALFASKNLGITLSAMVRPVGRWWLSASLVAPPGSLSGSLTLPGTVSVKKAERDGGGSLSGEAEISIPNPIAIYIASKHETTETINLVGHFRWQNLSVYRNDDLRMFGGDLEQGGIPSWYPRYRGFGDVFSISLGVEGSEDSPLRLGARLNVDSPPIGAGEISPMQPMRWLFGANTGAEIRVGDHVVVTGAYGIATGLTVSTSDSVFDPLQRIGCVDDQYRFESCAAARQGRAIASANGSYRSIEHSLMFSMRYDTL